MKKLFSAFLLLTCFGVFLISPVYAEEKKPPTLKALRNDINKLQQEMGALIQELSTFKDKVSVLEQQHAHLPVKMKKPDLYSYP